MKSRVCFSPVTFLSLSLATLALITQSGCPLPVPNGNGNGNGNANVNGNGNANVNGGNSGLTGQFIGSERCMLCHNNVHRDWKETLHARALDTLEAIGQGGNAECLPCHTVGFGEPGGFVNRATTNDLAGVGCESCHGPSRAHAENVADETLRPPKSISSEICGKCHSGSMAPHFDEWSTSRHAHVEEHVAEGFIAGEAGRLNSCGKCHSGDFFYRAIINTETLADNALQNTPIEDLHAVECAICHNPHARTGNAASPEDGRDFQLRFPEVASPTPTNTIDATTNAARFNLCGQCHHDRGVTWQGTARPPHHSNQANIYVGEMPMPDEEDTPLVLSRVSVHSFAREQCATCHMYRQDFMNPNQPAIAGHTFQVNQNSCATSGCHPSMAQALAVQATLQTEIQTRINDIRTRLGPANTWEYTANGGPNAAGQAMLSDAIKQVRFLLYYSEVDGSLGVHNPAYVRDMLLRADELLDGLGM